MPKLLAALPYLCCRLAVFVAFWHRIRALEIAPDTFISLAIMAFPPGARGIVSTCNITSHTSSRNHGSHRRAQLAGWPIILDSHTRLIERNVQSMLSM